MSVAEDVQKRLGWIQFEDRTDEQNAVHETIFRTLPKFDMPPQGIPDKGTKVLLTDTWRHALVREALGKDFTGWHQFTGSCVGVGGGNGIQTTNFIDALVRNEPEKIVLLLWAYNYGRSRQLAGMRGKGEGSLGSTFAKSCEVDGGTEWDVEGVTLPTPQIVQGQFSLTAEQEYQWSDGTYAPKPVRDEAALHKFVFAPLSSGRKVVDAICNGYGVLRAFSRFVNPNTATVRNGMLIGSYNGRGGHQESWLGYCNHDTLGERIFEMNQWGSGVYGKDPMGGADGGVWVPLDEVDEQCQNGEIYAINSFDGYPARPKVFDWLTQSLWS